VGFRQRLCVLQRKVLGGPTRPMQSSQADVVWVIFARILSVVKRTHRYGPVQLAKCAAVQPQQLNLGKITRYGITLRIHLEVHTVYPSGGCGQS
jgi:hypothetical protein